MVLQKSLLLLVFTYGSETMIWREKERSRMRAVQMDNLRGLLGIRRIDKDKAVVRNNGMDEKIDEGVLQWFSHWREWRMTGLVKESM